jgi:hypothetical protein
MCPDPDLPPWLKVALVLFVSAGFVCAIIGLALVLVG